MNYYYAVAHTGTAGLGSSYGYAELVEGEPPRSDQTTTVSGPHGREEALKIVAEWNNICDQYREEQSR